MLEISLILGFVWYQVMAHVGISAGLHRYWCHRAFKAGKVFEIVTLYMSILAGVRSPISWIAMHNMHHEFTDTKKDPHSPKFKGKLKVFLGMYSVDKIKPKHCRYMYDNPRLVFFHNHWLKIWVATGFLSFFISPWFFLSFVAIPAVLSYIGFGLLNSLCHGKKRIANIPLLNILAAGEGYHKEHHKGKLLRYHKYDFTGYILEKIK